MMPKPAKDQLLQERRAEPLIFDVHPRALVGVTNGVAEH